MLPQFLSTFLILLSLSFIYGQDADDDFNPDPNCVCVKYLNCLKNGTMNSYGVNVFNYRVGKESQCGDPMLKCCSQADIKPNNTSPEPPTPHVNRGCGYRIRNSINFRISGDVSNIAAEGEFPWMVFISKREIVNGKQVNTYKCGGSLINENVVITAAHCLTGLVENDIFVRAGDYKLDSKSERLPHQNSRVSNIIRHPQFDPATANFDIALLILTKPFQLADNVEVVCLPEANEAINSNECIVTGWGRDKFGEGGIFSKILKAIELPLVPSDECQTRLRKTKLSSYFILQPSLMCAGGIPGQDACDGDGGGPLVCPLRDDPSRYVQMGVVSWGIECSTAAPGVYANVALARPWIDETFSNFVINPSSYTRINA